MDSLPQQERETRFISGPPGSGKTTLGVRRLNDLLARGIPAEQILILVPQRTLAEPYYATLRSAESPAGVLVDVATIGGLARRTIDLFWPLVAGPAGFSTAERRPLFLTLETTQYHMDRIVEPFLAAGAFDGVTIPRPRLVSQIVDNLNKAAAVGFPITDIAGRLKSAWSGESARHRIYDQVQAVAVAFRQMCLEQNLLDWSLQIEVFWQHLQELPPFRRYLLSGYRHLIVDNVEEDIPATHDLLRTWLPLCESALILYDTDGGYRVFLGADPAGALALADACQEHQVLDRSYVASPEVLALAAELSETPAARPADPGDGARAALSLPDGALRFHPEMLDWVADEVSRLVAEEHVPPGEIAILAPFLSDALRFSLTERLARFRVPVRTHRPSRELREEPAARCLLTMVKLAHPGWRRPPPRTDVSLALSLAVADLDPVRARLLAEVVYRVREGQPELTPFHQIVPQMQERISYLLGGRYDELWGWLQTAGRQDDSTEAQPEESLDHFLSRLFGEVLSQPGFGFHGDFDAGAVAANLIESVQKFRLGLREADGEEGPQQVGQAYVDMVERGVVAAQYVSSWQIHPEDAVLLVPAYTFLMMNQPVRIQFWLDAGSGAWSERIYQPLTHPYVLSRYWAAGQVWTDEDEVRVRDEALARLVLGLGRRCRERIYLAFSELNERGYEQQGPLLQRVQGLLRWQMGGERQA